MEALARSTSKLVIVVDNPSPGRKKEYCEVVDDYVAGAAGEKGWLSVLSPVLIHSTATRGNMSE